MCRSAAEGGRRCPAHTPAARALDYRASLVVASDDPGVHAAALASDEPKLVTAGAASIDDPNMVDALADQAGLAGASALDGTVEETRAAAGDPATGYRVLRVMMHGPEGWARWQRAEEERQRRAAHSGLALWIDEDGQPQSGTAADLDAFLDARRAREDAIARGLAANRLTPDEAVEILRADADATTARRADAQVRHRGLRTLWSRIVPKRRRKM